MRLVRALLTASAFGPGCVFAPGPVGAGDVDGAVGADARVSADAAGEADAGAPGVDGAGVADAAGASFVPLHVPPGGRSPGLSDLVVSSSINTAALLIDGAAPPPGVVFDTWPQSVGPDLAVLHVAGLRIPGGSTVRVSGLLPLVVVASGDILIEGTLDAAARRDSPGPGGSSPDQGDGSGLPGEHVSTFRDSGGSGAGFATGGGDGGGTGGCSPSAPTVSGGSSFGEAGVPVLMGGSGGGTAFDGSCGREPAGAGGGAVQLSTPAQVVVTGDINVGGGGGGGGRSTVAATCNITAGSGGGSGGVIFLQAPVIMVPGRIAANGGAGGSSGGDTDGTGDNGVHGIEGEDGQLGTTAARPGADVGIWSSPGGAGGARGGGPGDGQANGDCDGNGGGGGGAVGRIVVALPPGGDATLSSQTSPSAFEVIY